MASLLGSPAIDKGVYAVAAPYSINAASLASSIGAPWTSAPIRAFAANMVVNTTADESATGQHAVLAPGDRLDQWHAQVIARSLPRNRPQITPRRRIRQYDHFR